MAKSTPANPEQFYARDRQEWRKWLEQNHARSRGIALILHKKHSREPGVSYTEAVEEALCFGWIDSRTHSLDADRFLQVFTPRKPGSVWSRSNQRRVQALIAEGRMAPAGLAVVEAARQSGAWNRLDPVEALVIPPDLKKALAADKLAGKHFRAFSDSSKKMILWWIASAKRPATRIKRIQETVTRAAKNQKPFEPEP